MTDEDTLEEALAEVVNIAAMILNAARKRPADWRKLRCLALDLGELVHADL